MFVELFNRLREGKYIVSDIVKFKERVIEEDINNLIDVFYLFI